ncbi:short-chain dehydrogenase/reductase [Malaciobacter marinus]|uniref:Short-chain dehydrogenase n=1 Tax=Malaciobacter marinus TaxID=505249 RepID=A0A347TIU8_9BACT|nr:SDR family NAD(P)-dependent oxidoreductase [Malaciobacter marinus]AXX86526.1 short-chain dehydrogenase/reductase [Malaciobacter marinus]PHO14205.1 short-chain dehydrogenase [Malaciobacter marinus]
MNLNNKTILITGANGGLGSVFVKKAIALGAKTIYCAARDIKTLEEIQKLSSNIKTVKLDITNKEDVISFANSIDSLDIIINNAGVNSAKRVFEDSTIDFDVNVHGTLNVCKILSNKLNKQGAIINITSVLALANLPIMGLYCSSKAALHSLTQALRAELLKDEIDVYEVLPGPIDTNMTKGQDMPKATPESIVSNVFEAFFNKEFEIFPDDFSKQIKQGLEANQSQVLKEFAMSVAN